MTKRLPARAVFATATALLLLLAVGASAADRYELVLKDRSYVPETVWLSRSTDSHLVVQFYDIPTEAEREALARNGVTLLDYIPNYAWTAHVRGGAVRALDPNLVRAVFELRPEDKIARSAEGRDIVRVFFHDDVENAEAVLAGYGDVISRDYNMYTIRLYGDLLTLAGEDAVKYVAGPQPEKTMDNDELRDNINADEVQTSPYDLHGLGLTAGIWDGGTAHTNHDDFSSRLTIADGAASHYHATMCTGIMAGDGTRSTVYGGTPYQWRGVATEADIASYDWPSDLTNMDTENAHAISNYDIVVSSNSWSWDLCSDYCYYFGTYDDWSVNYDQLVRGSQGKKLPIVFSGGNDGNCSGCSGDITNYPYGTIPGPGSTAKNTIVVGSNNADNDALSGYSSRGPTLDGRIKPDIVAPGCKSYEGINTTYTNNNYAGGSCGTSFSCPAVAGAVVLLQEDYVDKFGGEAWPSTVKALLIQGALDLGNTGADYEFGFGRVNIQNTIDIIRADNGTTDLIKEDTLSPSETWEYDIEVTAGEDLRVTLVWDDYPGSLIGGPVLVNDLDLELEAPGGVIHYPWLLDPSNPSSNATTGADHYNNVEQVEVSAPATGTWTVRVTATMMPEPDQDFSVVTNFGPGVADPPPAAPTGLTAITGSGEGEIDVTWDANSEPDLDHYRLERDDNPSFTSPSSFVTTNTYYYDSGLTPDGTYYYRVYAVDAGANESDPSATDSAVAEDLPPAAPTGLEAVPGAGEGEIDVSWNPNSEPDFDHYRLERSTAPDFEPGSEPFEGAVAYYADTGLVPGELYYYRVYAVDAGGNESPPSNVDSTLATDLAPAAPTGLVVVPGPGEGEIDVSWSANSEPDIDRYRVERSTAPDFEPGSEPFEEPAVSFTDTGLEPGETYYYRVYAIDAGEHVSPPSVAESTVATDLAPAAPTGLAAVPGAEDDEVDVTWDESPEPDLDHYRLERDTTAIFAEGTVSIDGLLETAYADSGLDSGTYYYRLFAVDAGANESAPGDTVEVTLEATGIDEAVVASVSLIRPNPFSAQTSIHYTVPSEGARVTMRIYDVRGRLVTTLVDRAQGGGSHQATWDGRDSTGRTVASGVYFCQIAIGDWGETRKIAFLR